MEKQRFGLKNGRCVRLLQEPCCASFCCARRYPILPDRCLEVHQNRSKGAFQKPIRIEKSSDLGTSQSLLPPAMEIERRALEGVLEGARDGDLEALRQRIGAVCEQRGITAQQVADQYIDGNGRRAIHLAAAAGHGDILKYLIDEGADLACRDASGHTPLYAAAAAGRHEIVKLLSVAGAESVCRPHVSCLLVKFSHC